MKSEGTKALAATSKARNIKSKFNGNIKIQQGFEKFITFFKMIFQNKDGSVQKDSHKYFLNILCH